MCLKEFASRESALANSFNPYGADGDRIVYLVDQGDKTIRPVGDPIDIDGFVETRELQLVRLPSGFWRWLPRDSDDLAMVQEHLVQQGKDKQGYYIFNEFSVAKETLEYTKGITKFLEDQKNRLKRQIFDEFSQTKCEDGKIYKVAFSFEEVDTEHYRIIRGILLFCEVE